MNQDQLEQLYARLEVKVFNVVYRWLWDRQEAHDVTQEAFVRLWNMRARVDLATVDPLVYRIAVNLASNRRRAAKLRQWIGLDAAREHADPAASAHASLEEREREEALRRAIDALPERLRRVVALTEIAGISYADAARVLEIPAGTIASRRNAALAALRIALGAHEDRHEDGEKAGHDVAK